MLEGQAPGGPFLSLDVQAASRQKSRNVAVTAFPGASGPQPYDLARAHSDGISPERKEIPGNSNF